MTSNIESNREITDEIILNNPSFPFTWQTNIQYAKRPDSINKFNIVEQKSSIETFLGPSYSQLFKLLDNSRQAGLSYMKDDDMDKVYLELGKTLNLAYRNLPLNNNIFLNMMLSYGFQAYYPSNVISDNRIADKQQQYMQKRGQEYIVDQNF